MGACMSDSSESEQPLLADYQHCNLTDVPEEIFGFVASLQVILLDSNALKQLPKALFNFTALVRMGLADNEIEALSPNIGNLIELEELDISRNNIPDIPDDIRLCSKLTKIDCSVNPIGRLPDGFSYLTNMTEVYLNDVFLEYLPDDIGRLSQVEVLELRENQLTDLPESIAHMGHLRRLDLGNNHFEELPVVIGSLMTLRELWADANALQTVPNEICYLRRLFFLDLSQNILESLPRDIHRLESLEDLHLNENQLKELPDSLGLLQKLTVLKLDQNELAFLPRNLGNIESLTELSVSSNNLQQLPISIGCLHNLCTLIADDNKLSNLPSEVGSCQKLGVLSLRNNQLHHLPHDIGRLHNLVVLSLCGNRLECLPYSLMSLSRLSALWLSENQAKPLIPLQTDTDHFLGVKVLTCYMFPQSGREEHEDVDAVDVEPSQMTEQQWANRRHSAIVFSVDDEYEKTPSGRIYPKDVVERHHHHHNKAPKLSRQPSPSGRQSPDRRTATRHVSNERETTADQTVQGSLRPMSYLLGMGSSFEERSHFNGPSNLHTHYEENHKLNNANERTRGPLRSQSLERISESAVDYFDGEPERRPRYRMASDSMTRQRIVPISRPLWPEEVLDVQVRGQPQAFLQQPQERMKLKPVEMPLPASTHMDREHSLPRSWSSRSPSIEDRNDHVQPLSNNARQRTPPRVPLHTNPAGVNDFMNGSVPEDSGHGTIEMDELEYPPVLDSKRVARQLSPPVNSTPPPPPLTQPESFCVELLRDPRLGFSVAGGYDSMGNPNHPADPGIFITRILDDGPAAKTGLLLAGDKLLEVNGQSLLKVSHMEAIEILKKTGHVVSLVVQRLDTANTTQGSLL